MQQCLPSPMQLARCWWSGAERGPMGPSSTGGGSVKRASTARLGASREENSGADCSRDGSDRRRRRHRAAENLRTNPDDACPQRKRPCSGRPLGSAAGRPILPATARGAGPPGCRCASGGAGASRAYGVRRCEKLPRWVGCGWRARLVGPPRETSPTPHLAGGGWLWLPPPAAPLSGGEPPGRSGSSAAPCGGA